MKSYEIKATFNVNGDMWQVTFTKAVLRVLLTDPEVVSIIDCEGNELKK